MHFKSGLVSGQRIVRPHGTDLYASRIADDARGQYLCEICEDVHTNDVLPAAESPRGVDLAICAPCRATLRAP